MFWELPILIMFISGKIEIAWARQVAESPANRYSFVCSAMLAVCREVDNDR